MFVIVQYSQSNEMGRRNILFAWFCSLICGIKAAESDLNDTWVNWFKEGMVPRTFSKSDIDMDYYLGGLRSSCDPEDGESCQKQCHGAKSVCQEGQCYCHHTVFNTGTNKEDKRKEVLATDEILFDTQTDHATLRHHIAHFCPNLDIARVCIRKCMETGKPAFCGKDHTCYCGHRYTSHDHNEAADADAIYKNFKDLYEKYFGAQASGKDEIIEQKE